MTGINPVWTNRKELKFSKTSCLLGCCQPNDINLHVSAFIIPLDYGGNVTSPLTSVPTSYVSQHGIQSEESRSEALQHTSPPLKQVLLAQPHTNEDYSQKLIGSAMYK